MTESVKHTLIAARKLIEKPENWTQGAYATDAAGNSVMETSPRAVCWCMAGAVWRAAQGVPGSIGPALNALEDTLGVCIEDFNDAPIRKHSQVLKALDRTIEAAP